MSTMSRVTQHSAQRTMMAGLQSNLSALQKLQEQLSSGKRLSRPSDAPVATGEAMLLRAQLARSDQYVRNAADGLAWLGTADTALTGSLPLTGRVRDLVLQGLNDTVDADGRAALAAEVDALRASLQDIAETRYLDRPVFGGNSASPRAFTPDGSYAGDQGAVVRTVAPGTTMSVNVTGDAVFGADGDPSQLFTLLSDLSSALREPAGAARSASLAAGLGHLDAANSRLLAALGQVGARYNRVETMRVQTQDQQIGLTATLSDTEDVDLARTVVALQTQEVAYQAALGATARAIQPSLMDFLR